MRDIISGYKNMIRHYIYTCDYEKALCLCEKVIETTDYGQIQTLRLFKDILEACFEVTANHSKAAAGLWNWAKAELQKVPQKVLGRTFTCLFILGRRLCLLCNLHKRRQYCLWQ